MSKWECNDCLENCEIKMRSEDCLEYCPYTGEVCEWTLIEEKDDG